jgi:hypothetical protein
MDPINLDPDCHTNCDCTACLQPDTAGVFQPPPHCKEAQGSGAEPSSVTDPGLPPRGDPGLPATAEGEGQEGGDEKLETIQLEDGTKATMCPLLPQHGPVTIYNS